MNEAVETGKEATEEDECRPSSRLSKQQEEDSTATVLQHPHMASPNLTFPGKLFIMLERATAEGFDDVVSWLPNVDSTKTGMIFKVHKTAKFASTVLPRFFLASKHSSFTRQLHYYNFQWIQKGPGRGGYYNPRFCKADPSGCFSLQRRQHSIKSSRFFPVAASWRSSSSSLSVLNDLDGNEENKVPPPPSVGTLLLDYQEHQAAAGYSRSMQRNPMIEEQSLPSSHNGYSVDVPSPRMLVANEMSHNNVWSTNAATDPNKPYPVDCTNRDPPQKMTANLLTTEDWYQHQKRDDDIHEYTKGNDVKDERQIVGVKNQPNMVPDHCAPTNILLACQKQQQKQQRRDGSGDRVAKNTSQDKVYIQQQEQPVPQAWDTGPTICFPSMEELQLRTMANEHNQSNPVMAEQEPNASTGDFLPPRKNNTCIVTAAASIAALLRPRSIEEMVGDPLACYNGIRSFRLLTSQSNGEGTVKIT